MNMECISPVMSMQHFEEKKKNTLRDYIKIIRKGEGRVANGGG